MVDASEALELLADRTRRRLLFELRDRDPVDVSEGMLVRGHSRSALSTTQRQVREMNSRMRAMKLKHHHLPKLRSGEVIEWDRETGTVSRGAAFEDVEPFLHLMENNPQKFPSEPG
jgi:hypothetical protein